MRVRTRRGLWYSARRQMRPRVRWLANVLLALVSAALALARLEGAARLARHYQRGGKEQRTRLQYTEYDPLLGWKHQAGRAGALRAP